MIQTILAQLASASAAWWGKCTTTPFNWNTEVEVLCKLGIGNYITEQSNNACISDPHVLVRKWVWYIRSNFLVVMRHNFWKTCKRITIMHVKWRRSAMPTESAHMHICSNWIALQGTWLTGWITYTQPRDPLSCWSTWGSGNETNQNNAHFNNRWRRRYTQSTLIRQAAFRPLHEIVFVFSKRILPPPFLKHKQCGVVG